MKKEELSNVKGLFQMFTKDRVIVHDIDKGTKSIQLNLKGSDAVVNVKSLLRAKYYNYMNEY